jgi:hypothetical protein
MKKRAKKAFWQILGQYEYEVSKRGYTGWYRCVGGRMANGLYPEWHCITGEIRYG